ncbi:toxin [Streptomyces sp. WM4235]|uniref:toxin n=1 Tax=Streptomyces sp. WM4235 TaxID=1415551 RepID=UPI0006AE4D40|nr:toxin [Streptomyces sp. WM4235]KOU40508.1 toxin [Streptomyces sp. WM4235]
MRRESRRRLASFGLPESYDLMTLCDHLGGSRGRPVHLLPMPLDASGPCGLWLAFSDADYVVYEQHTSRHHQEHIIAHELAHMLCDHRSGSADSSRAVATLFPDLDPSLVRDLLCRDNYSDTQEREAEVMAFLLGEGLRSRPGTAAVETDGVVGRIRGSLDWRRGTGRDVT